MRVRDFMSRDVQMVDPNDSLRDAARTMADADIGALPVSAEDRLVGMVTDRDIAVRGVAEGLGPDAEVRDVMTAEVRYCYEDDEVDHVLQNMGDIQVRRLPVLDRDKRLVGIVALADLASRSRATMAGQALSGISRPGGEHSQIH